MIRHILLIIILGYNNLSFAQTTVTNQFLISCEVSYGSGGFAEQWTYWYLASKSDLKALKQFKCSDDSCDLLDQFTMIRFKEVYNEYKGIETLGCCEAGDSNQGIRLLEQNEERFNHYIDSKNEHLSSLLQEYSPLTIPTKIVEKESSIVVYDLNLWIIDANICECKQWLNNKLSNEDQYFISKMNKVKKPSKRWSRYIENYFVK